jgi:hypothetical protein
MLLIFSPYDALIITESCGRVVNTNFWCSARKMAILTEGFRGFSQSLQANAWIVA